MNPTRISTLLAIALAAGLAVWLGLHFSYAQLPSLPWSGAVTFGVLALGDAISALNVRARLRGRAGTRRLDPLIIARFAVFAKASAYTAAGAAGAFAGVLIFVAPELSRGVGVHDAIVSGVTLATALALVGAGLFLEYTCRVPKPPEERGAGTPSER